MLPQEIIRRKRDGHALSAGEIGIVVRGIADGSLGDTQVAADTAIAALHEPIHIADLPPTLRPTIRDTIAR